MGHSLQQEEGRQVPLENEIKHTLDVSSRNVVRQTRKCALPGMAGSSAGWGSGALGPADKPAHDLEHITLPVLICLSFFLYTIKG